MSATPPCPRSYPRERGSRNKKGQNFVDCTTFDPALGDNRGDEQLPEYGTINDTLLLPEKPAQTR
jgi:hypothetical protein